MPRINQKLNNGNHYITHNDEPVKSQFLKLNDLVKEYQLPKSTVYHLMDKQGFPRQIKIGKRACVWRREAVDKWFSDKEAQSVGVSS